jgi:hypothetical protein
VEETVFTTEMEVEEIGDGSVLYSSRTLWATYGSKVYVYPLGYSRYWTDTVRCVLQREPRKEVKSRLVLPLPALT